MATEEQLVGAYTLKFGGLAGGGLNWVRVGQVLTPSNRVISKLEFKTYRVGSPTGTITFTIRKQSDSSIIASKVYGSAGDVPLTEGWIAATFDTPVLVNEAVAIQMEWSGVDGDDSNYLAWYTSGSSDVKADEYAVATKDGIPTTSTAWRDAVYIYTYETAIVPTVTTQAVTDIAPTTATGNGNITNLGTPSATQHGHCWSTSANPTTADSKTENGVPAGTGAFTSTITGLTANTLYHVRAYATNSIGTSYGADVQFTTLVATAEKGTIWQEGTKLHWIDENGAEQSKEGTVITTSETPAPPANLWFQNFLTSQLLYVDMSTTGRKRLDGVATGVTGQPKGTIWVEGADLHGIDETGAEVYIQGG